jgi:hypothetical protein
MKFAAIIANLQMEPETKMGWIQQTTKVSVGSNPTFPNYGKSLNGRAPHSYCGTKVHPD